MKFLLLPLMVLTTLSLTACSSLLVGETEFGCKGMPNSVTCMSVRDVHKLTDGENYQEKIDTVSQMQLNGEVVSKSDMDNILKSENSKWVGTESGQYVPVPKPAANPQPIRSESMVMRVLIDPYENTDGDLIITGYVYTEISPRKWEVGVSRPDRKHNAVLKPLQTPDNRK
ncbi:MULTISPECIES: type IV conjugative transfer system lipoprotein TraV [Morganellaceae]|nr:MULTISPECIES: type IV conjugative transfer system lipoprotein TraV [Morganellaceae]MBI6530014.1 type IV conjugative transfer system lipoprotein TraV [Proteus vulgaris]TXM53784.1 type IV conjugative transfer system lipoprotein TraV [Providencia rettgeri]TXM77742.1 type IV conjugative transfer system lipoprotein TraV [Providencia rettgeri]UIX51224.1 hypothetical protein [Providencia rettgeri]